MADLADAAAELQADQPLLGEFDLSTGSGNAEAKEDGLEGRIAHALATANIEIGTCKICKCTHGDRQSEREVNVDVSEQNTIHSHS